MRRIAAICCATGLALVGVGRAQVPQGQHWAFVAPVRPAVPELRDDRWSHNPFDRFVLERMRAHGAEPSPPADRATLARRLHLDLLGLPPSLERVAAFVADTRADAVERLVAELLASPHYGERMALRWLDLARYADTHGFHVDAHRDMRKWREWVIDAFNCNQPFDRFTVEQLAGDLLPGATLQQRVATGFNRNHMINVEGGADPDEYAVRYVVDRVNTTATVWLGLTVGCAECHDHKFDPISQRDYYQLYALLGNVPEKGLDGYFGNAQPFVKVPSDEDVRRFVSEQQKLAQLLASIDALGEQLDAEQAVWEAALRGLDGDLRDGLLARFDLDGDRAGEIDNDAEPRAAGQIVGSQLVQYVPGRIGRALQLDGTGTHVRAVAPRLAGGGEAFTVAAFVAPRQGGVVAGVWRESESHGWALEVRNRAVSLVLSRRRHTDLASATVTGELDPGFNHVAASYDGSGRAAGIALYVNGRRVAPQASVDKLSGSILTSEPLRIGAHETGDGFDGAIDDLRVYAGALAPEAVRRLALQPVLAVLRRPIAARSADDLSLVREYFRRQVSPRAREIYARIRPQQAVLERLVDAVPTSMVMAELDPPRQAHVRLRGDYRRRGAEVTPDVPAVLPPLPTGAPRNRLTFARWLVSGEHPLTARVFVNRVVEQLFGAGIVRTSDDLGTRGERPTHPELLDWLAVEFASSGWDVKRLVTLLATSATYAQASHRPHAADAEGRWLSAMRRMRLPAELVRDNALAIAGLLDLRLGGPSVKPLQPAGLWEEVAYGAGYSAQSYEPSPVQDRYRRGLYVYVKRAAPYASFRAFDVPTREVCTVQRDATTTPAQAFVLMNDPVYVEAARALALRLLTGPDASEDARLRRGFGLCVARDPSPAELAVLRRALTAQRQHFAAAPDAAAALLSVGDAPRGTADARELAAWTMLASVLLNKSETITRP